MDQHDLPKKPKKPPVLEVNKVRRRQKRKKRRVFEASEQDWAKWDEAAKRAGLNFSEFARRAIEYAAMREFQPLGMSPGQFDLMSGIFSRTAEFLAERPDPKVTQNDPPKTPGKTHTPGA